MSRVTEHNITFKKSEAKEMARDVGGVIVKKGYNDYRVIPKQIPNQKKSKQRFHAPNTSGKRSFKSGNPLKKLLAHNRATVRVGGY